MRYWLCTFVGLTLCLGSLLLGAWAIYELMHIGTCASGGPYVSARPCPPGTELRILAIFGGVFALLTGIGVYAARGARGNPRIGLGATMWGLGFLTLAAAALLAAFGGAATDDGGGGKLAAGIMAGVFVPMGLVPLVGSFFVRGRLARAERLVEHGKRAPGRVTHIEDTGVTINDSPRVKIRVSATPRDGRSFEVEKTTTVSRVSIPRVGDPVAVFYDPDEPEKAGISFDAQALSLVGLTPTPAAPPTPPTPPSYAATPPDADFGARLEALRKLGELRASGVLTAEEFEREKARLLAE